MQDAAIAHLENWLSEVRDPDPEQRRWKQAYADGGVIAYARLGLLSPAEAERWRARLADPDQAAGDAASDLDASAREAGERHLAQLIDRVPPMRRGPDLEGQAMAAEASTAIDALHAVGLLDGASYASWRAQLLAAQAPWLDEPAAAAANATVYAVAVPPENEQEAAQDAARAATWAARPKASAIRRVIAGSAERLEGLAIVAAVVHEDATSLHFHYLGGPWRPDRDHTGHEAHRRTVDGLAPPILRDGSGREYEPLDQGPSSSSGAGGVPDPNRRDAITGRWMYTPAAPEDVELFHVERGEHRWTIGVSDPLASIS